VENALTCSAAKLVKAPTMHGMTRRSAAADAAPNLIAAALTVAVAVACFDAAEATASLIAVHAAAANTRATLHLLRRSSMRFRRERALLLSKK